MFDLIVEKAQKGIAPGHKWGVFEIYCKHCGNKHIIVERIYIYSEHICDVCGELVNELWLSNHDPCDGPWLDPVGWETAPIITRN